MSDAQDIVNDPNDDEQDYDYAAGEKTTQVSDGNDFEEAVVTTTTTVSPPFDQENAGGGGEGDDDYDDDGPLPDVTVNLVIQEAPVDQWRDLTTAMVTDEYEGPLGGITDAIERYSSTLVNELEGNGTTTGKQGWFGKSNSFFLFLTQVLFEKKLIR